MKRLMTIFLLLPLTIPVAAESRFFIGAYDARHWAGLTLTTEDRQGFGLCLVIEKEGKRASGYDIFHIVKKVGPNSGDGRYACLVIDPSLPFGQGDKTPILDKRLPSDTITWEWAQTGEGEVVGRIVNRSPSLLYIGFYSPWDYKPRYSYREGHVEGEAGRWRFQFACDPAGVNVEDNQADLLKLETPPNGEIYFSARIGRESAPISVSRQRIAAALQEGLQKYEKSRVAVSGANSPLVESITNNLNWMVLLQPETPALYTPAGRRWIFPAPEGQDDHWTLFEWDSFFNALLLGVESKDLAKAAILAVLQAQYPNGCIANWRGRFGGSPDRAQPPVGSFAVLKLYRQHGDRGLLESAYPYLKSFNLWWTERVATKHGRRDGNDNGLLEWGSDADQLEGWKPEWERNADGRTRAAWESGQDDLPNWDNIAYNEGTWTMELDSVDLNSLFALDSECLSIISGILGKSKDEAFFRSRRERTRRLMNKLLWDEPSGMYRDRHWKGSLSGKLAAANFFSLIAGIPDEKQAGRMLKTLTDPALFWGEFIVPTISRNDPAFVDQQYWRGTIWPPTNYLIYQGLLRYGFWKEAAQLAQKSVRLFLDTWNRFQLCRENYDSRSGEGGGQRYQSWGPLFALAGVEEFLNWDIHGSLKVGSTQVEEETKLSNIADRDGRRYIVTRTPSLTELACDGKPVFRADAPIVLRDLDWSAKGFAAEVYAIRDCRIELFLGGEKFQALIDNDRQALDKPILKLKPGRCRVRVNGLGR